MGTRQSSVTDITLQKEMRSCTRIHKCRHVSVPGEVQCNAEHGTMTHMSPWRGAEAHASEECGVEATICQVMEGCKKNHCTI